MVFIIKEGIMEIKMKFSSTITAAALFAITLFAATASIGHAGPIRLA